MCTGLRAALRPALAPIELGDEREPAMARGVEVTCQAADLGLERLEGEPARPVGIVSGVSILSQRILRHRICAVEFVGWVHGSS